MSQRFRFRRANKILRSYKFNIWLVLGLRMFLKGNPDGTILVNDIVSQNRVPKYHWNHEIWQKDKKNCSRFLEVTPMGLKVLGLNESYPIVP